MYSAILRARALIFTLVVISFFGQFTSIATASAADKPININTAAPAVLSEQLPGIGPAKARAIVLYREQNGPFKTLDQLMDVKGIGTGILKKIRHFLYIDNKDVSTFGSNEASDGAMVSKKSGGSLNEQERATRRAVRAAVIIAKKHETKALIDAN